MVDVNRVSGGMTGSRTWGERFFGLRAHEKAAIAVSVMLAAFLVLDPLVLAAVRGFDPELRRFFRLLTDLGRSGWILIPAGAGILVMTWLRAREVRYRRAVIYGYVSQWLVFLFAAVALSGLLASLSKNIIGRARPKFYDELGPLTFRPFTFDSDFASFPSGHATSAGALAGVLAILWPQARIPLFVAAAWIAGSRFLIGAHYFSDAMAGCALGVAFTYLLRDRLARRRWLFERDAAGQVHVRGQALMRVAADAITARVRPLRARAQEFVVKGGEPRQ